MSGYIKSKVVAEQFLLNECKFLKPFILRPGLIWDWGDHRLWTVPLMYLVAGLDQFNELFLKLLPLQSYIDWIFPAAPTMVSTVSHFCIEGAMGRLDTKRFQMIENDKMLYYESTGRIQEAKPSKSAKTVTNLG